MADARARLDAVARVGNFAEVWAILDFPRLLFNTVAIAIIGMIGTVALVHPRRVRIRPVPVPRPDLLFTLLIATIFLPGAVTLIPTYTIFSSSAGWARGCRCSCRRSSPTPSTCS